MRIFKKKFIAVFIVISTYISTYSLASVILPKENEGKLFQVAFITSLAQGVYDSNFTYGELFKHGDFGLGTFNHLDGEMVALDGKFYQITSNGELREAQASDLTPFAEVNFFKPKQHFNIQNINNYTALTNQLLTYFDNKNVPYAFRIDGNFSSLKLRSIPKQFKPYPNLVTAASNEHIFNLGTTQGTLVGYYFPNYFANIAVPGFHLHFISSDRTTGGHVLELAISQAKLSIQPLPKMEIVLPNTLEFATTNLENKEIASVISHAEKNPEPSKESLKSSQ